jgi:hypothetical protein
VRCITRLDETCREVRDAARVIGDKSLFSKMEEAQALIKRDSEFTIVRPFLVMVRIFTSIPFPSQLCLLQVW